MTHDEELRAYLRNVAHFEHLRAGWVYKGVHDFLLREGRVWSPEECVLRRGLAKHCFDNAYKLARRRGLQYVEGYATAIIPVHHAWVIDHEGRIIEKTWPEPGLAYFGVVLPLEFVLRARLAGCASVLANHHDEFQIYRQPFGGDDDDTRLEVHITQSGTRR